MVPDILQRLALKVHNHQLVPFLGAGCSLGHVDIDWDGISKEMAQTMPSGLPDDVTNPEIAEAYAECLGDKGLAKILSRHLIKEEFDDSLNTIPLQIMALELRTLYTSNQDNILELCSQKYGRPYTVVSTLQDLAGSKPGDRLLFKYHGSLETPETLIFTQSQYDKRINDPDHFLNIRLRSDLLSKSFFFVGYSFRDPNITMLFRELSDRFGVSLPGSFLLAYQWTRELDELCHEHGVECIDPSAHISDTSDNPSLNLESFLKQLCSQSLSLTSTSDIEELFDDKSIWPNRIAIHSQIASLKETAHKCDAKDALSAFRGVCDMTVVPESLQPMVAEALVEIIRKSPPDLHADLWGTFLNLEIQWKHMLGPTAAYLALFNRVPEAQGGFEMFILPPDTLWPTELLPVAVARAIELLDSWEEEISENFWSRVSSWIDGNWSKLPDNARPGTGVIIRNAWRRTHKGYDDPVRRAENHMQKSPGAIFDVPSIDEIANSILANFPKRLKTPHEE